MNATNTADDVVKENAKLPLRERLIHSHWKVRQAAYQQLLERLENVDQNKKEFFASLEPLIPRIAKDNNAPAQLSGLASVIKFIEVAPHSNTKKISGELGQAIGEKGMTSSRSVNLKQAVNTIIALVDADCGFSAIGGLMATGFKKGKDKAFVTTMDTICTVLEKYGAKHVPVEAVWKRLPDFVNHRKPEVRNAMKKLAVMINLWTGFKKGAGIEKIAERDQSEFKSLFEANKGKPKPKSELLARSERDEARKYEEEDKASGTGVVTEDSDGDVQMMDKDDSGKESEEDGVGDINLWEELKSEVATTERNDKGNAIKTESWGKVFKSEKPMLQKEAIEVAISIIGTQRIEAGSEKPIVERLIELLKKTRMVLVIGALAKLLKALLNGLRNNYPESLIQESATFLITNLKETKKNVATPIDAALDLMKEAKLIRASGCKRDINAYMKKNKNAHTRARILAWLTRSLTAQDLRDEKNFKFFCDLFISLASEQKQDVRDGASLGLALLYVEGRRHRSALDKSMKKLDSRQMAKIEGLMKDLKERK